MMKIRNPVVIAIVTTAICFLSVSDRIQLTVHAGAESRPPMYVLQVGMGKYLDVPKWADLRGSVNDVVEMRKLLVGERFQVPAANIVTLTNEQGTKQKIFASFKEDLIDKARQYFETTKRRDAVVLFQYSGHGSQAPDADGDEADKLDETLVTYDSRDIKGKNFDITDDEIFALTSELRRYTDNIVYIFDSCHSGSGTRNAEDARRLPARTTVPESIPMPGISTRSGQSSDDGSDGSVMPPGTDYIVISAAQADQLATQKYCFEECGSATEPVVFGLLTFYLIDELKNARADSSYHDVLGRVIQKVEAERPSQTPLVEGDDRRTVFGSLGKNDDAYLPIVSVSGQTVRLGAGAVQGITPGSIVSIYDRAVSRFDGSEKKASGRVTSVTATTSTVQLSVPMANLTAADKAVAASPDIGSSRTRVILDSSADPGFSNAVHEAFAPKAGIPNPRGVNVLSQSPVDRQTGRWDLAVLKDHYSKVFSRSLRQNAPKCENASAVASLESDIYYIAGPDYVPLFGFCVEARSTSGDRSIAADKVINALTHIARYRSIQQIQNRRSRLAGRVSIKPIRLSTTSGAFSGRVNCVDGKFVVENYEPVALNQAGRYPFDTGDVFWFEVTNNSAFDVYAAMLNLRSDGSIKLQFPRNIDEEKNGVLIPKNGGKRVVNSDRCRINADGDFAETGAFRTSREPEFDGFKFLVTTSPLRWEDLAYLEMDSLTRNRSASLVTIDEWIALDLTFDVGGQKK